nr:hypothetical protein [Brevundimonas abyssalis]
MSLPSAHDPRVTLARPDLAEQALEGVLEAGQYRAVTPMQCVLPTTPVRDGADDAAVLIDQLASGKFSMCWRSRAAGPGAVRDETASWGMWPWKVSPKRCLSRPTGWLRSTLQFSMRRTMRRTPSSP